MNHKPTPETDEEVKRMTDGGCPGIVCGDFARKLERSRDNLMKELEHVMEMNFKKQIADEKERECLTKMKKL